MEMQDLRNAINAALEVAGDGALVEDRHEASTHLAYEILEAIRQVVRAGDVGRDIEGAVETVGEGGRVTFNEGYSRQQARIKIGEELAAAFDSENPLETFAEVVAVTSAFKRIANIAVNVIERERSSNAAHAKACQNLKKELEELKSRFAVDAKPLAEMSDDEKAEYARTLAASVFGDLKATYERDGGEDFAVNLAENDSFGAMLTAAESIIIEHRHRIDQLQSCGEVSRLRGVILSATESLIDAQNMLHGIRNGGPAKRECKDLEKRLNKSLEVGA